MKFLFKRHQDRDLQWYLTLGGFVAVLILGTWGYGRYDRHYGHEPDHLDNVLQTLRLVKLKIDDRYRAPDARLANLDEVHSTPWQLDVARLLLPLVFFGFGIQAIYAGVRSDVLRWRARKWTGHVVLGDVGDSAEALGKALLADGHRVVGIDPGGTSKVSGSLQDRGLVVVRGKGTDPRSLAAAGVAGARAIVALGGTAGRNLEVLLAAQDLVRDREADPLLGIADVEDPIVLSGLQEMSRPVVDSRAIRSRLFSGPDAIARDLWARWPLEQEAILWGHPEIHLVLVGLGAVGSQIALRLARLGFAPGIERRRLTVVDRDARVVAAFRRHHPWFESLCELEVVEADATEGIGLALEDANLGPRTAGVAVCVADDDLALRIGFDLVEVVAARRIAVPIWVRMAHHAQLAGALGGRTMLELGGGAIEFFGALERLWTPSTVLDETQDLLARAVHEHYLENWGASSTSPAAVPWAALAELYKTSSRLQADHLPTKLRAIGARAVATATPDPRPLDDGELEVLARLEHDRWVADRVSAGWTRGPRIDPARREHPSLIPFDDLSQEEQDKDRTAVAAIPDVLSRAGLGIVRERRLLVADRAALADERAAARRWREALDRAAGARQPVLYASLLTEAERSLVESWDGPFVVLIPSGLAAHAVDRLVPPAIRARFEALHAKASGRLRLDLEGEVWEPGPELAAMLDRGCAALAARSRSLEPIA